MFERKLAIAALAGDLCQPAPAMRALRLGLRELAAQSFGFVEAAQLAQVVGHLDGGAAVVRFEFECLAPAFERTLAIAALAGNLCQPAPAVRALRLGLRELAAQSFGFVEAAQLAQVVGRLGSDAAIVRFEFERHAPAFERTLAIAMLAGDLRQPSPSLRTPRLGLREFPTNGFGFVKTAQLAQVVGHFGGKPGISGFELVSLAPLFERPHTVAALAGGLGEPAPALRISRVGLGELEANGFGFVKTAQLAQVVGHLAREPTVRGFEFERLAPAFERPCAIARLCEEFPSRARSRQPGALRGCETRRARGKRLPFRRGGQSKSSRNRLQER